MRLGHCMAKKHASLSASRSKAPVGRSAGRGTTCGGSQAGPHQTRAQTRTQADPQPEVVNGGQPRFVARERVQEQVVQDTPYSIDSANCCFACRRSDQTVECVGGIGC
ncbi:hypothetical protein HAX54_001862 [Datura stramonium]|uniref:Uncharacterized protein n=1 Tax=Datura stramonium TaxID=4076 RepID=A0ABS8T499_DATST|nr:hypothetical protein [Datura stramonium]